MYIIKTAYKSKQISRVCLSYSKNFTYYYAISIKDNKTEICPECSLIETLDNFIKT